MSNFENREGQFKKIPENKRVEFLLGLQKVIRDNARCFLYSALVVEEFEKIKPEFPDVKISAYEFCVEQCLSGIHGWMAKSGKREEMAVVFEQGNKVTSEGIKLYLLAATSEALKKQYKVSSISFMGTKEEKKPLQAADMFAYEIVKYRKNTQLEPEKEIRKSFRPLVGGMPIEGFWNSPEGIRRHFNLILLSRNMQNSLRSSFLKPCP